MTVTDAGSRRSTWTSWSTSWWRSCPPASTDAVAFLGEQFDRGLAWVHFPEGCGGLGGTPGGPGPRAAAPASQRRAARDVPQRDRVRHGRADDRRARHRAPEATGTSARSSRARRSGASCSASRARAPTSPGSSTRAVRDGDEWIINGQKVWTTLAHLSRFGLLLARTDPDVPKHAGMTMFLVDMQGPGVDVRPLYQITGEAEFNEVLLHRRAHPRRGPARRRRRGMARGVDDAHERAGVDRRQRRAAQARARSARRCASTRSASPATPTRAARCSATRCCRRGCAAEVLRLTNQRAADARRRGTPGPGGLGREARLRRGEQARSTSCASTSWAPTACSTAASTRDRAPTHTAMGTTDLHKAFLRVAGQLDRGRHLRGHAQHPRRARARPPGDVRVDKEHPWKDVPRS